MSKLDRALEKEILRLTEELERTDPDTVKYSVIASNLGVLMDRRNAAKENRTNGLWNGLRIVSDLAAVGVTTFAYNAWVNRGFQYELTGTYTSKTFSNFLSKLRPSK